MPRSARVAYEFAFYHVFNRGLNKEKIFQEEEDYRKFLLRLQALKTEKKFDHSIYAYSLMPNHFHLLLQTRVIPLAKIMSSLLTSYSMYYNHHYERVGILFQNRFKSKLVDRDSYFLGGSRYILLNPIEAGLVRSLSVYPWSSYQELFGHSPYSILDRREVHRLIGETGKEKRAYHTFLLEGIKQLEDLREEYSFEKDIEGPPLFATHAQRKYLRRVGKSRK